MDQKSSFSYPLRFALLLGLTGVFIIVAAGAVFVFGTMLLDGPILTAMNRPENASPARLINTIAALLSFFMPALVLARIVSTRPFAYLGFNARVNFRQLVFVFLIAMASMVLSGALGALNEWLPIPAHWAAYFRKMEDTYKAAVMAMANLRSFPEYLIALLVIAAAPALFEEVLFRGALQTIMVGWTQSKWTGIIITSILFSAVHISFFGFLPRVGLGIVLGLVFYHSRNIWLPILLHFLNNAFVVTQLYIVSRQGKSIEKTLDESMPIWWGLIAIGVLFIFFRVFIQQSKKVLAEKASSIYSPNENISI